MIDPDVDADSSTEFDESLPLTYWDEQLRRLAAPDKESVVSGGSGSGFEVVEQDLFDGVATEGSYMEAEFPEAITSGQINLDELMNKAATIGGTVEVEQGSLESVTERLSAMQPDDDEVRKIRQAFARSVPELGPLHREFLDLPELEESECDWYDDESRRQEILEEAESVDGETYNAVEYESRLNDAVKGLSSSSHRPIWEEVPWLKRALEGEADHFKPPMCKPRMVPMPPVCREEADSAGPQVLGGMPAVPRAPRYKKSWVEEVDERRQTAVAALKEFLEANLLASRVGRQISKLSEDDKLVVVHDTIRTRSINTVKQRLCSLLQYERYMESVREGPCFPFYEEEAYNYVVHLRSIDAPPTRAQRFMEAVRFAHFVLGVEVDSEILKSKRIDGAVFSSMQRKRMLLQREPLTVEQVTSLETWLVEQGHGDLERANLVGSFLFCLHTRSRWGDINAVSEEPVVDGPWFDARTGYHKTYNRPERRHRWLPLAGLADGVSGRPWVQKWLELRKKAGLKAAAGVPFVPMPNGDGTWSECRVSSSAATTQLREVLAYLGTDRKRLENVGTHSLKSTLLSWCAKAGVSMDDRRLLGNHIQKKDISVLTYSRDTLSAPLRRLKYVVGRVRDKTFCPDQTRSGMWNRQSAADKSGGTALEVDAAGFVLPKPKAMAKRVAEDELAVQAERALEHIVEDQKAQNKEFLQKFPDCLNPEVQKADGPEEESMSEPSEESSTDDEKAEREIKAKVLITRLGRAPAFLRDDDVCFRHVKYGTFHLGHVADPNLLACGRLIQDRYVVMKVGEQVTLPRCRICFGTLDQKPDEGS